jgi:putative addiction module component (TIGR02574 family)
MGSLSATEIAEMPVQQRIQLVENIWDSISELPESVEIPAWHKEELEKRMQENYKNPTEGFPWSEVMLRIMG